ncbi:MAG: hypothetical protein H8E25_14175 [Planctomycetes bacterium]|nr:hypothetical protein [Planctomycetota bacterium]
MNKLTLCILLIAIANLGSSAPNYRQASVFGVSCIASNSVPASKFKHMASVLAQYLDNDEDGVVDDPNIVSAMIANRALMVQFVNEPEANQILNRYGNVLDTFWWQEVFSFECFPQGSNPQNGFDATLEEVLHLVSSAGWANAYPSAFREQTGSELCQAMDVARGGHFNNVPNNYPSSAWYHYDDQTCDYGCQATEYFYWLLTSILGAQDYAGRGNEIDNEWEPHTPSLVQSTDLDGWALMHDPRFVFPTVLPDGNYR